MASTAIYHIVHSEFWWQNNLWIIVFSSCAKRTGNANISCSDRDIAIESIFKMLLAAILDFSEVKSEGKPVSETLLSVSLILCECMQ